MKLMGLVCLIYSVHKWDDLPNTFIKKVGQPHQFNLVIIGL